MLSDNFQNKYVKLVKTALDRGVSVDNVAKLNKQYESFRDLMSLSDSDVSIISSSQRDSKKEDIVYNKLNFDLKFSFRLRTLNEETYGRVLMNLPLPEREKLLPKIKIDCSSLPSNPGLYLGKGNKVLGHHPMLEYLERM